MSSYDEWQDHINSERQSETEEMWVRLDLTGEEHDAIQTIPAEQEADSGGPNK